MMMRWGTYGQLMASVATAALIGTAAPAAYAAHTESANYFGGTGVMMSSGCAENSVDFDTACFQVQPGERKVTVTIDDVQANSPHARIGYYRADGSAWIYSDFCGSTTETFPSWITTIRVWVDSTPPDLLSACVADPAVGGTITAQFSDTLR